MKHTGAKEMVADGASKPLERDDFVNYRAIVQMLAFQMDKTISGHWLLRLMSLSYQIEYLGITAVQLTKLYICIR